MDTLTIFDHLLLLTAFVAAPIYFWKTYPAWTRDVARRGEPARLAGYRETLLVWIGFAVALLALWAWQGRDWTTLGLGLRLDGRFLAAALLSAAAIVLLYRQIRAMRSEKFDPAQVVQQAQRLDPMVPRTEREKRWFRAMAVNAGITEELICRGFAFWYLQPMLGTWGAAVAMVILFTTGHAYQGRQHVPTLLVVSAFFVGLYLLSGSLWLPILVHAVMDLMQGQLLARSFEMHEANTEPAAGTV